MSNIKLLTISGKGLFTNYVDKILVFFDHLPPCVDIFYGINVDKKWIFWDHLPTLSCKRSLSTTPNLNFQVFRTLFSYAILKLKLLQLFWCLSRNILFPPSIDRSICQNKIVLYSGNHIITITLCQWMTDFFKTLILYKK